MFLLKKLTRSPISLTSNDDKRIKPINAMDAYAYGRSKYLVSDKEEIKCNNIVKPYKKWLTLMML